MKETNLIDEEVKVTVGSVQVRLDSQSANLGKVVIIKMRIDTE
jgi:hypothetical protein